MSTNTKYHVLNLSFELDPVGSAAVAQAGVARYVSDNSLLFDAGSFDYLTRNTADAVIKKAADN